MTKRGFYAKLAAQSIRKNGKFYIPYFISCVCAAAMFYITIYLYSNKGISQLRGAEYVQSMMLMGGIVIAMFTAVVLFYTNSFLMKRRKKELGLYNVLGMGKRHIAKVMFWETVYTSLIGIIGGIAVGILLSKLFLLLMCAIMKFEIPFGFEISIVGIIATVFVYGAIFFMNLLTNLIRISKLKPIELLHSANEGEREPKTKWVLAVFGVLTLGLGYVIAALVQSPVAALALFFLAVILVIIGTYCLFTTGSIAILKMLRKNKNYYYKAKHFTSVSGMIHRMKRNAAGLASICILSTMVLVTVSSTLSLYVGAEDSLGTRYPYDIALTYVAPGDGVIDKSVEYVESFANEKNVVIEDIFVEETLNVRVHKDGDTFSPILTQADNENVVAMYVITDEMYARQLSLDGFSLKAGEAYGHVFQSDATIPNSVELYGKAFTVIGDTEGYKLKGEIAAHINAVYLFVVNESDLRALDAAASAARITEDTPNGSESLMDETVCVNVSCEGDEQVAFFDELYEKLANAVFYDDNGEMFHTEYAHFDGENRVKNSYDFYDMYGGFFFLGIFLGTIFAMATVLIIYYKQISEGYEDADRFRIMQQVGMSEKEVKSSIGSQILTVFFLPLVAAGVHILAAFHMIAKMLALFNLYNVTLFALCCGGTFLVFAAIYAIIYVATARAYYKIIKV